MIRPLVAGHSTGFLLAPRRLPPPLLLLLLSVPLLCAIAVSVPATLKDRPVAGTGPSISLDGVWRASRSVPTPRSGNCTFRNNMDWNSGAWAKSVKVTGSTPAELMAACCNACAANPGCMGSTLASGNVSVTAAGHLSLLATPQCPADFGHGDLLMCRGL